MVHIPNYSDTLAAINEEDKTADRGENDHFVFSLIPDMRHSECMLYTLCGKLGNNKATDLHVQAIDPLLRKVGWMKTYINLDETRKVRHINVANGFDIAFSSPRTRTKHLLVPFHVEDLPREILESDSEFAHTLKLFISMKKKATDLTELIRVSDYDRKKALVLLNDKTEYEALISGMQETIKATVMKDTGLDEHKK